MIVECKRCHKKFDCNPMEMRTFFRRLRIKGKEVGFHEICKQCEDEIKHMSEWNDGKLLCHKCGQYLDPSEFGQSNHYKHRDHKDARCRKCRIEQSKVRRQNLDRQESLRQLLQMRYLGARERAHKHNIPFDITKEYLMDLWIEQKGLCAISKIPMTHVHHSGRVSTNVSIDQINPNQGYTKGNVQLVCMAVNQMKSDLTMNELLMYCKAIVNARKWKH